MRCLVIVAHPDDEVIWMGGVILRHPQWDWHIVSLCRSGDPDRAPRFKQAAQALGARAYISDLDDSPQLAPFSSDLHEIKERLRRLVPADSDYIFTHGPAGEYTRHKRHEQVHRAVCDMVESGELSGDLLCFAYSDSGGASLPKPDANADVRVSLLPDEYTRKKAVIKTIYGFGEGSREYESTGQVEAFRILSDNSRARLVTILTSLEG